MDSAVAADILKREEDPDRPFKPPLVTDRVPPPLTVAGCAARATFLEKHEVEKPKIDRVYKASNASKLHVFSDNAPDGESFKWQEVLLFRGVRGDLLAPILGNGLSSPLDY